MQEKNRLFNKEIIPRVQDDKWGMVAKWERGSGEGVEIPWIIIELVGVATPAAGWLAMGAISEKGAAFHASRG